ncbi:MAG: protein kinase [Myxococcaceae bacterium]
MDEGAALEEKGHLEQALALYVRKQQWENAARLATSLDRNLDAAKYCLAANNPYEAAVCFQKAGALKECLDALVKVPPTSLRYRHACVHAVRVAQMVGTPLPGLLQFFAAFVSSRPNSRAEATALTQVAGSFAQSEKARLAASILRTVLQAFPDDAEAREMFAVAQKKEKDLQENPPLELAGPPRRSSGSGIVAPPSSPQPPMPPAKKSGSFPAVGGDARKQKLADFLISRGKVLPERLATLYKQHPHAMNSEAQLREALVANELITDAEMVRELAYHTGIRALEERELLDAATPEAARALTMETAEKFTVAPVSIADRHLTVAMHDPRDIEKVDKLRFATGLMVTGVFATEGAIRKTIGKVFHGDEVPEEGDWRGQIWDPIQSPTPMTPFSDRYTGTRERQFDTQDLERRMNVEALGVPEVDKNAPGRVHTVEIHTLPAAGEMFASRYKVEALVGEGGSAGVFKAIDQELGEPVALKIFRTTTQKESDALINRFKLELSLSRLLVHPNIVRLFDLGVHGSWRYLTMELLEGADLGARMTRREHKPIGLVDGLKYLEQICLALHFIHERGVIHRDIKPQNLFITNDGVVKLMDFGIAKRQQTRGVTITGMIAGTPEYISPEQISAFSSVSHKTDLYALGGTAYTLFTGAPPFTHPELMGLLLAQSTEIPKPPSTRNPQIPPELDQVILEAAREGAGQALRVGRRARRGLLRDSKAARRPFEVSFDARGPVG